MAKGNEIMLYLMADNKELKAKLSDSEAALEKMKKTTQSKSNGIISSLKAIGSAVAGYLAVGAVKNFAKFTGEIDSVTRAFDNLAARASGGSRGMLAAMREASSGTISNLNLMKNANLAIQLLGQDVLKTLPEMARIARAAAVASGKDVNFMMESLVVAAGRQSVLVLDNLGISSATASQYMDKFAASLGKTRTQLTDAQKKEAFFYATMQAGRELIRNVNLDTLTLGEKMQVLSSNLDNAKVAMADGFNPGLNQFSNIAIKASKNIDNLSSRLGRFGSYMALFAAEIIVEFQALGTMFQLVGNRIESVFLNIRPVVMKTMANIALEAANLFERIPGVGKAAADQLRTYYMQVQYTLRNNPLEVRTNTAEFLKLKKEYDGYAEDIIKLRRISEALWNGTYKDTEANRAALQRLSTSLTDVIGKTQQLKNTWSDYYAFLGDKRSQELAALEEHKNELLKTNINAKQNSLQVEEAYQKQRLKIIDKYDNQVVNEMKKTAKTVADSFGNALTGTVKNALSETLQGENGFKDFGKQIKKIFADLVVDLGMMMVKAAALRAIMAGATGGIGGVTGLGGALSSLFFENGRLPVFKNGRMPVLQQGYVPADHFAAFIGAKEAVIDAQTTRANYPLLKSMMANKGQPVQSGSQTVNFNISGNVLSDEFVVQRIVPTLKETARREGGKLFYKEGYR